LTLQNVGDLCALCASASADLALSFYVAYHFVAKCAVRVCVFWGFFSLICVGVRMYLFGCGWGWDLHSSGLLVLFLFLLLPAALDCTHLDSSGTWLGILGHALTHFVLLSGVPGPLRYWAGTLPGVWVVVGLVGPRSCSLLMPVWPRPGRASGLSTLVHGRPLAYGHGGSVRGLPMLSSGWICGCPCSGLLGFCALWGLLVTSVLGSSLPASEGTW